MTERVLYLVICAAGPASRIDVMVNLARQRAGRCTAWLPQRQSSTSWTCPR